MRKMLRTKFCLFVTSALILPIASYAQLGEQAPAVKPSSHMESHVGNLTGHSEPGRELYFRYCWGCHGPHGDGNGENAAYLNPTPRNFVAAVFKCRSTITGTLPTDQDLYNSIGRGFNFTNMPSWIALTDQDRANLVAFIKTFSPRWVTEKPGTPIPIPPEPKLTLASIQHGQQLFQKLECWKCHGQEGRGDGPSASTLTDSNDQPIRPYNFTADNRSKCGSTNQDLYKIFMTGVDGTPMPSFADVVKPEEAWDLVHFLRTLQYNNPSPELTLWESTPEGKAIVAAKRVDQTNTGSGEKP
ncbi:MAG TPA: cytochrome c [Candidatus Eisenbacteria bacterium]|nr:cytochrome c [Candidatus Eisenbacteria bacterium]